MTTEDEVRALAREAATLRDMIATHRYATAKVIAELLQGILAAHPEAREKAMQILTALRTEH